VACQFAICKSLCRTVINDLNARRDSIDNDLSAAPRGDPGGIDLDVIGHGLVDHRDLRGSDLKHTIAMSGLARCGRVRIASHANPQDRKTVQNGRQTLLSSGPAQEYLVEYDRCTPLEPSRPRHPTKPPGGFESRTGYDPAAASEAIPSRDASIRWQLQGSASASEAAIEGNATLDLPELGRHKGR
jgi:hypothetical protein